MSMEPVDKVAHSLVGAGYDNIKVMKGGSFKQSRTIIVCPTRGMIHHRVATCHQQLMSPMNQARHFMYVAGDEVGDAYNNAINMILNDPQLSQWEYIMTVEDDNILPSDAHIRLLESINSPLSLSGKPGMGGFPDAVSGIYFTKGDWSMPMAYGDAEEFRNTGKLDFRPRTPAECVTCLESGLMMEVNGIAMGCALWRMSLLRSVPPPWYVTVSDVMKDTDGNIIGPMSFTQDLKFCDRARRIGHRFAVDFRVKVGHLDVSNNRVY